MSRWPVVVAGALGAGLVGCAGTLTMPRGTALGPAETLRQAEPDQAPPTPTAAQAAVAPVTTTVKNQATSRTPVSARRQYFDQRKQRYYFYDPARRAYFWEDGTPKT